MIYFLMRVGDMVVRKYKRYTSKTIGRMVIFILFFGATISTLGYTLVSNLSKINDLNNASEDFDIEMNSLVELEEAIEADIKRLSDPLYVARYAREKYFYSKDGELILRMDE